jgi:WD40 repeat protein
MSTERKGEAFEFLSGRVFLHKELSDIYSIAVNEKSNFLALGLANNSVVLRHLDSFEEYFRDTKSHESYVWSLIFSEDGDYLFSGDNDGNIIKWNVKKKKLIQKFHPHEHNVRHFRIYENNLISASLDGNVIFTDMNTLKKKKTIDLTDSCKLLLNESKHELFIGKYNGTVDLLDLKTNENHNFYNGESSCWSLIYFQENDSYFFGTEMGNIIEFKDGKVIKNKEIGSKRISEMIFHEGRLVVVSMDEYLRILDPFTLDVLFVHKIDSCRFTWVLNVKNQYFITCGVSDQNFQIWYLNNSLNVLKVLKRKRDFNIHFCFK